MVLLFGLLLLFLALSVPVGISIGMSAITTIGLTGVLDMGVITRSIVTAYDSFPLLAVPLFVLAGEIMCKGQLSEKLFDFGRIFLGRFTGGIPMAVVVACLIFGALSGSGAADTAAIGAIMIPAMVRMGYDKVFCATLVAAAGGLATIMPPSMSMIMLGITTNTSIGSLFKGGILPAFLVAGALMVYCNIYCRIKGFTNDKLALPPIKHPLAVIKDAFWALLTPIIIMGSIYGGLCTPTEAAGLVVVYSLIISLFVYRSIKLSEIVEVLRAAVMTTGPIMVMLGGATVFSRVLTVMHVPEQIAAGLLSISQNPIIILLLINLLLLIVGIFMETLSSVMILSPILLPVAIQLGMNPIHFGVVMVLNLVIGFITPPMAMNLFVVSSITDLSIEKLSKGIIIPLLIMIACLVIVTAFPAFTMALQ